MEKKKRLIDEMWDTVKAEFDMKISACPEVLEMSQIAMDAFDWICQFIPEEYNSELLKYMKAEQDLAMLREKETFRLAMELGVQFAEETYLAPTEKQE